MVPYPSTPPPDKYVRQEPSSCILDQMKLILPDVLAVEQRGRTMEVLCEAPNGTDVGTCGSLKIIAALEFVEHLSEVGSQENLLWPALLPLAVVAAPFSSFAIAAAPVTHE